MQTYKINSTVVFATSPISAIRQAVQDADDIRYLTADVDGRYSQYAVDDELVTVYNLKG